MDALSASERDHLEGVKEALLSLNKSGFESVWTGIKVFPSAPTPKKDHVSVNRERKEGPGENLIPVIIQTDNFFHGLSAVDFARYSAASTEIGVELSKDDEFVWAKLKPLIVKCLVPATNYRPVVTDCPCCNMSVTTKRCAD